MYLARDCVQVWALVALPDLRSTANWLYYRLVVLVNWIQYSLKIYRVLDVLS
jgi:hypothetical protein